MKRANKINDAAIKSKSAERNRKELKELELYIGEDRSDQRKSLINSVELKKHFTEEKIEE